MLDCESTRSTAVAALCCAAALAVGCGAGVDAPAGHSVGRWDLTLVGEIERGHFGASLSIGPDVDGDGLGDLLVGAPGRSPPGPSLVSGRTYLFSGKTGQELRRWTGAGSADYFGACVSLGPDTNGDGAADVVIGATNVTDSGTTYLYSGASGTLLHEWTTEDRGRLGAPCALGPDVDGDGRGDVAVADLSVLYDPIGTEGILHRRGKVRVYSGGSGQVLWQFKSPRQDTASFGSVMSMGWPSAGTNDGKILVGLRGGLNSRMDVSLISTLTGVSLQEWSRDFAVFADARLGPDATGDGVADVVAVVDSEVELWSGATGEVAAAWSSTGAEIIAAVLGPDATGDGIGDVVVSHRDPESRRTNVVLYDGHTTLVVGRWELPSARATALAFGGDIDGDGLGDFAIADDETDRQTGRVWVFLSATESN